MNARLFGVAAAALFLVGCDEWELGDWDRYKEDFQYSYQVNPNVRIYLETRNGGVEIMGWERNDVQITGTKHASSEGTLRALKIDVVASGDSIRIRTAGPSGHRGSWGARYVMRVPRGAVLENIESSNAGIRVESLTAGGRLRTSNGGLKIYRVGGPVEATTSNASVEIGDVTGSVVVRTSNGAVRADNVRGILDATTSNAGMNVTLSDPEPQRPVRLVTSNGGVTLTMNQFRDNDVHVSTSNSSITVRLPSNVRAALKANTSNSSIDTDFEVMVRAGEVRKTSLEGTIGGGGGPIIDLTTSNGGIRVLRL
ncbi:MAG TPA: hypothetical protein VFL57_01065 [Bryobacteraceae bacterium]|nr:hypothetical protein [Bryobacteraceae bacterium]